MSSAFQCDRCGILFADKPCFKYRVKDASVGGNNKFMDLCPNCQKIVDRVMSEPITFVDQEANYESAELLQ